MTYADKLFEKKVEITKDLPTGSGYDSEIYIPVDDLVSGFLEKDREIKKELSKNCYNVTVEQVLQSRAFCEFVKKCEETK